MEVTKIEERFKEIFATNPFIFKSPGRINIIGEHTDYNCGFVLPAAIDKAVFVAIAKRNDDKICLFAEKYNEYHNSSLKEVKPVEKQWPNYVLGVVNEMQLKNKPIGGFNLYITGDVPGGAGLSSSAALECAVAAALNTVFELAFTKMELVEIAQQAEHRFAGVRCGIMDQFASVFGKKDQAIRLDCDTLDYRYIPIHMPGYQFVLFNTNVKHNLASSAYNDRRAACFKGVEWIKVHHPSVNSLRQATIKMLEEWVKPKDLAIYTKCKFVVEEIERLQLACTALENNNLVELGRLMFATHYGLSREYEVSCNELDFLVDRVKGNPAVLGARMMGGGFGGCTINLIKEEAIAELENQLSAAYQKEFGRPISTYLVKIENGTEWINETVLSLQ